MMPKKEEILRKARELSMLEQMRVGLPAITPTEAELKETGMFYEARRSLMTVDADVKAQQMSYLEELASELDMRLVSRRDFEKIIHARATSPRRKKAEPKIQLRTVIKKTVVGKRKKVKIIPKKSVASIILGVKKPKRKPKRKKRHTTRTGKTMRALRKVNGVRVFSFSADVWKVRPPRKKRR